MVLKLNIGNYQSLDIETNEYDSKSNCYAELHDILSDWVEITDSAKVLRDHIGKFLKTFVEADEIVDYLKDEEMTIPEADTLLEELIKEEPEPFEQDLKQVTPMFETEKAFLIVKNGLQTWIPKSTINNKDVKIPVVIDLDVSSWIVKALKWETYIPRS